MRRTIALLALAAGLAACGQGSGADTPLSADLEAGREVFGRSCSLCHGPRGQGGAAPALDGVVDTFGNCQDQAEWIRLGSARHLDEAGPTYGDGAKEVRGGMPSFEDVLTDDQRLQVSAYMRHRFGGLDASEALAGCGLDGGASH